VHEIIAFDIRPVSSGNEVTHHFLEVAYSYEKRLESVDDGLGPETVFAILSIKIRCSPSLSFEDLACFLFGSTLLGAIGIIFSWIKNFLGKPDDLSQSNSMLQNSIKTSINDSSTNLSNSCEMRRDDL
jgi:hypothetical protein